MKHLATTIIMVLASVVCFASCNNKKGNEINSKKGNETMNQQSNNKGGKVLVAFFSHTGENYAVGNIKKGNTHIVAEMIAENTGGDLFEIVPVKDYPTEYTTCTEVAQKERTANARPDIKADKDIADYDTIYIGYPIWWGDAPMPVYTWIEKHQWQGKTVIPFCTHEGSGLGSSPEYIGAACKGATIGKGLEMHGTVAQNQQAKAKKLVENFLK